MGRHSDFFRAITELGRRGPGIVAATVGVILVTLAVWPPFSENILQVPIALLGGFITTTGVFVTLYVYLSTARRSLDSETKRPESNEYSELKSKITKLASEIARRDDSTTVPLILTDDEKRVLKEKLATNLEKDLVGKAVSEWEQRFKSSVADDRFLTSIRSTAARTQSRLAAEVNALGRRSNVNLLIGITISIAGLSLLTWFIFTFPREFLSEEKKVEFALYFFTRLSLVVFVEVFAYFFLRLYRYGIFEIKYFQNEITNAEFRVMALEAAMQRSDNKIIEKICTDMSKTERNFVLKKGETTREARQAESERLSDKTLMGVIERFLDRSNAKGYLAGQHAKSDD